MDRLRNIIYQITGSLSALLILFDFNKTENTKYFVIMFGFFILAELLEIKVKLKKKGF